MLRRKLLALLPAALLAQVPLAMAQHADLGTEAETAAPEQRRFMMEDTYGNVVTNEDLLGHFALIYFGYTGCPDVCPTSLSTMADVMVALGAEAERVKPVFVTVDPDRDTARLLRDYVAFFDERIIALRGPRAYTDHMVKTFNARYEVHVPDPATPQIYSIDHTASIAFLGPDGVMIQRFPHGLTPDQIVPEIRAAIAAVPAQ